METRSEKPKRSRIFIKQRFVLQPNRCTLSHLLNFFVDGPKSSLQDLYAFNEHVGQKYASFAVPDFLEMIKHKIDPHILIAHLAKTKSITANNNTNNGSINTSTKNSIIDELYPNELFLGYDKRPAAVEEALKIYLDNLYVSRGEVELLQIEQSSKFPNLDDEEEGEQEDGGDTFTSKDVLSDMVWVENLYVS
jgi:hypothetical protein